MKKNFRGAYIFLAFYMYLFFLFSALLTLLYLLSFFWSFQD